MIRRRLPPGFRIPALTGPALAGPLVAATLSAVAAADEAEAETSSAPAPETAEVDADAETETEIAATDPGPVPLDRIGMAGLQEAFRALRQRYIHRDRLTPTELNRAALQGVLERLDFGAILEVGREPSAAGASFVFASASLPDRTAYLRPVRIDADELRAVDDALASFRERDAETLILDLRAPLRDAGFEAAAQLADRFLPANQPIFRVVQTGSDRPRLFFSRQAPSWDRDLVVLIDDQTGPAGEAVAAVLRAETESFLVGTATPGRTVEYDTVSIGDGLTLRLAVAELILPDGGSLFRKGVHPDFLIGTSAESKEAFFNSDAVEEFLFETQRPRLNEAALVEGANPELTYFLARSRGETTRFDTPPVVDRVVQRAFDLLAIDRFLEAPKPETESSPPDPDAPAEADPDAGDGAPPPPEEPSETKDTGAPETGDPTPSPTSPAPAPSADPDPAQDVDGS